MRSFLTIVLLIGAAGCNRPARTAVITVKMPGVRAEMVDGLLTGPVGFRALSLNGMIRITSISTEGTYRLYIIPPRDADAAHFNHSVRSMLEMIPKELPGGALPPDLKYLPAGVSIPTVNINQVPRFQVNVDLKKLSAIGQTISDFDRVLESASGPNVADDRIHRSA